MQTPDDHWNICTETAIKAKSMAGYSTYSRKMTQNKFLEGVGRPEVVDDWDQRLLMTTLLLEREARKITLIQVAEKDQVRNIVRCFFSDVT